MLMPTCRSRGPSLGQPTLANDYPSGIKLCVYSCFKEHTRVLVLRLGGFRLEGIPEIVAGSGGGEGLGSSS